MEAHAPPFLPERAIRRATRSSRKKRFEKNHSPRSSKPTSGSSPPCHDDDDPGEIAEGWFSIDGKVLTVTDANGRHVGSRAMLEGEDARVVAKRLLRGKKAPEEEFNRPLSYPNAGLA